MIMQYDGPQSDLLVTVKTCVVTPLARQLKQLVCGNEGSFVKLQAHSTCPQEEQIAAGMKPLDPSFRVDDQDLWGELTTYKADESVQKIDPETKKNVGRYPSIPGLWMGVYENLAQTILGKGELAVRPEGVRDVLKIIELMRESNETRVTMAWN